MTQPTEPKKCPRCGKWYKVAYPERTNEACLVMHPEGTCCHYSQVEVPEPKKCNQCLGSGVGVHPAPYAVHIKCPRCNGTGQEPDTKSSENQITQAVKQYLASGGDPDFVITSRAKPGTQVATSKALLDLAEIDEPLKTDKRGILQLSEEELVPLMEAAAASSSKRQAEMMARPDPAQGELTRQINSIIWEAIDTNVEEKLLRADIREQTIAIYALISRQVEAELRAVYYHHQGYAWADDVVARNVKRRISELKGEDAS